MDIRALTAGGFADSASQDTFCSGTTCTISIIYDQSLQGMVNGRYYNDKCCFDYGNGERNSENNGNGTMDAIYWGNCTCFAGVGDFFEGAMTAGYPTDEIDDAVQENIVAAGYGF